MKRSELGKYFRQKRVEFGYLQSFAAKQVEIHQTHLNRIEKNPKYMEKVSDRVLDRLAQLYGFPSSSVLLGNKPKAIQEPKQPPAPLPVVGYANTTSLKKTRALGTFQRVDDLIDPKAYAVILDDESMKPIQKGTFIVVSPALPLKENSLVVAKVGEKYLFRNYQTQGDKIILNTIRNPGDLIVLSKNEVSSVHLMWGMTIKT